MGRKGPSAKTKIVLKSVKQWEQLGNMHNLKFQTFLNKNPPTLHFQCATFFYSCVLAFLQLLSKLSFVLILLYNLCVDKPQDGCVLLIVLTLASLLFILSPKVDKKPFSATSLHWNSKKERSRVVEFRQAIGL